MIEYIGMINRFYRETPGIHSRYSDPVLVGDIVYVGSALHLMLYLTRKQWLNI